MLFFKKFAIGIILIGCCVISAQQPTKAYNFKLLSQQDNFEFLDSVTQKNYYDKAKWIHLGDQDILSFGGDVRFQLEHYINEEFGSNSNKDKLWYLMRNLLHIYYKHGEQLEIFAELNNAVVWNKPSPSPVDADHLSVNQLFVKYSLTRSNTLLLGRENLNLGSRRLIDVREGPNVRRSFDLVRFNHQEKLWNTTLFAGIPVINAAGRFDNEYLHHKEFLSGIYASTKLSWTYLDSYAFYQYKKQATYNVTTGKENRYSIGARFYGAKNSWHFDNEIVLQTGSFDNQTILGYTASLKGDKTFQIGNVQLQSGIKAELISGDKNGTDGKLNTFNSLYPRGAYFGRVAKFGPANLMDVHPSLQLTNNNWYTSLDYDIFWRYSVHDAIYNPALKVAYNATNTQRFIGHQIGTISGFNLGNHLNIELETNIIFPGDYLKASNKNNVLFHTVFTTEYKF